MNLLNSLISLVFPNRCIFCYSKSDFLICEGCLDKLNVDFNRCEKCSSPIPSKGFCATCIKEKREFVKGFSLLNYKDEMVKNIVELIKFKGYFGLVSIIDHFENKIKDIDFFRIADCLIPVPMHKSDIRQRGFNQAVLIAKRLSKITRIPVCYDCVLKVKRTRSQVGLSMKERKQNLNGVFRLNKLKKGTKKVIIVDDVFTTGSTINEISKTLKTAGVESYFFTLASTPQIA